MRTFLTVLLAASAASVLWAAVATWQIWAKRPSSDRSSAAARVASALFVFLGLAFVVHLLAHYPTHGDRNLLSAIGVALSLLQGIVACASPRHRLPLLVGSLGMAFLWYASGSAPPPIVSLPSHLCLAA